MKVPKLLFLHWFIRYLVNGFRISKVSAKPCSYSYIFRLSFTFTLQQMTSHRPPPSTQQHNNKLTPVHTRKHLLLRSYDHQTGIWCLYPALLCHINLFFKIYIYTVFLQEIENAIFQLKATFISKGLCQNKLNNCSCFTLLNLHRSYAITKYKYQKTQAEQVQTVSDCHGDTQIILSSKLGQTQLMQRHTTSHNIHGLTVNGSMATPQWPRLRPLYSRPTPLHSKPAEVYKTTETLKKF